MGYKAQMNYELWGLFASSFIASTLLPGGSEVALAWLVNQGNFPLSLLLVIAITGNTLGGGLTFVMGWVIAQYYPAKLFNNKHQQRAQKWLIKHGPLVLLLSWLPLIGDPLCVVAGWLRLNPIYSLLYILLGKAVRYIFIASFFV